MQMTQVRRAWAAPIAAHLAALCLVLIAGAAFVGTYASLSADEGAAIVQARQLAEHHSWIREHPYPTLDPQGRDYPYHLSARGEDGFAPFAKHPLYALVLSGLWRVGGINGLVGLSIGGTLVAALIAGRFARRLDPRYERFALWALGLGSPLIFDSYLVIAHTVGAALAGGLLLLVTRRSSRHFAATLAGAAALSATLVLMRTEGVLFAGVTAVVVFVGSRGRQRWLGVVTGVAGVAARFIERAWALRIVGPPVTLRLTAEEAARERASALGGGGIRGRIDGALLTLFHADYGGVPANALLGVALVGFVAAVVVGRSNRRLGVGLALVAAACTLTRVAVAPPNLVPGLFVAAPIVWTGIWAGLVAFEQRTFRPDPRLVFVLGGFVLAVVATQYAYGGGVEWGGRFFALALPLAIPLAVAALGTQPVLLRSCVVVAAIAVSSMGIVEIRRSHVRTESLFANLRVPDGAVPVAVSGALPRLDWRRYDERKWLLELNDVAALIDRLQRRGARRVYLVYPKRERPPGIPGVSHPVANTRWRTIDIELD